MMLFTVDNKNVFAATGGIDIDPSQTPSLIMVHGAGMDSSVWQQQTRYLAHRNGPLGVGPIIAVDLPGHGRSGGPALSSIADMADWLSRFLDLFPLDSSDRPKPVVAGHSMGTFIALELAARHPELVDSIALFGTATGMPVHPDLLAAAKENVPLAASLMAGWSHGKPAHLGPHPAPGMAMTDGCEALIERSLPGVLAVDLAACAAYEGATEAARGVRCRTVVVIGSADKMTPAISGRTLAETLDEVTDCEQVQLTSGHMMMTEVPGAVRQVLLDALGATKP